MRDPDSFMTEELQEQKRRKRFRCRSTVKECLQDTCVRGLQKIGKSEEGEVVKKGKRDALSKMGRTQSG